ncbi:hypothetical protein ACFL1R_08795 [Candidatus Latescibacterota bacterium]
MVKKRMAEKASVVTNRETEYDFPPYWAKKQKTEYDEHVFLL